MLHQDAHRLLAQAWSGTKYSLRAASEGKDEDENGYNSTQSGKDNQRKDVSISAAVLVHSNADSWALRRVAALHRGFL